MEVKKETISISPSRKAASLLGLVAVASEAEFGLCLVEQKRLKTMGRGKETLVYI